jgi:hypothetical protein
LAEIVDLIDRVNDMPEAANEMPSHDNRLRWTAYANRRPVWFGMAMIAAIVALRVAFLGVLSLFVPIQDDGTVAGTIIEHGVATVVSAFVILPVETFLGKQLPISILGRLGVTRPLSLVALSAMVFGAMHLFAGAAGFLTGASAGLVLSYGFLCWRQESVRVAFWRTTAVHAAHNAIGFSVGFLRLFSD